MSPKSVRLLFAVFSSSFAGAWYRVLAYSLESWNLGSGFQMAALFRGDLPGSTDAWRRSAARRLPLLQQSPHLATAV